MEVPIDPGAHQAIDPVRFNEHFRRASLFYLAGAVETFAATNEIINCYHITS
ncbi:hypothetical protein [Thiobacillus thioparus]|uniref:hypothetical protein n=1 Tax=Thiobacillus thioparus TaxID=931 RepID=UPI000370E0CA|nr:hypothetical protein [Thiobacillus thioparus]